MGHLLGILLVEHPRGDAKARAAQQGEAEPAKQRVRIGHRRDDARQLVSRYLQHVPADPEALHLLDCCNARPTRGATCKPA